MEASFTDTMVSGLLLLLASVALAGITAVVTYLSYWWALHNGLISLNENGKLTFKPINLPPGSMGLPVVGHTLEWAKKKVGVFGVRWRRHGEIYKTHLFGEPTVVVTTQEAAKKLLVSNGASLKGHSPAPMVEILGPHFLVFQEGDQHTLLRKRLMKHLQPEALKSIVPAVEELALRCLGDWSSGSSIVFVDEIERYTLGVGMLAFLGPLPPFSAAKLNQAFNELEKGFVSKPINKPGYQYYDSMQARNRFRKEVHDIINKRRMDQNSSRQKDILDSLIDNEDPLPQDVIDDNCLGFLFASNRTTGALISFTVKYLHDHPDVLSRVKGEQDKIRSRKAYEDPLSWEDLKDMPYTHQVMQESSRISNPVGMQYRVVEKELKFKGYVIPKNWRLISLHRQWHVDPRFFPDPYKFDPSRFQTPQKAFSSFGMGTHFCAGYELARMEILIFLHHFVTKFRWEITKNGRTEFTTVPIPCAHLPLKLTAID